MIIAGAKGKRRVTDGGLKTKNPPALECNRCIMTSDNDPDLIINEHGLCNHCVNYDAAEAKLPKTAFETASYFDGLINEIKERGKGRKYDAIVGVSGGVDSTYLAWLCKENGLRILLVHCDNGWNSEIAVANINNICSITGYNLYSVVLDWESFKDLQLAFLKSGVVDIELPYDYALYVSLIKVAKKLKVPSVLSGHNLVTEGTYMPKSWVHNKLDLQNILDIHNKFGTRKLVNYPKLGIIKYLYYQRTDFIKVFRPLDVVNYKKEDVKRHIIKNFGWRDYGGKHYESIFTRFFQGYILPRRFNIDKRQYHLSTLIQSGQLSRIEAIREMEKPIYASEQLKADFDFILKKFHLSKDEFEKLMDAPIRKHDEFKNINTFWKRYFKTIKIAKKVLFLK